MNQEELNKVLIKHAAWLKSEPCGERADLTGEDLQGANLHEADLRGANLHGADLRDANLQGAYLHEANLQGAYLHEANLQGANLHDTDLQGANLVKCNLMQANLDYASWPLWCGSLGARVDVRIARQLAYHLCRLDCDDPEFVAARAAIADFANGFHRVEECGKIEVKK